MHEIDPSFSFTATEVKLVYEKTAQLSASIR